MQDFTIGSLTPATQTIPAGGSAAYNFSVLPVGSAFTNAVNLSCSGAPTISLCSFAPNPVTPGNNSTNVVLTISTTASSDSPAPRPPTLAFLSYSLWLGLPGLLLLGTRRRRKRARLSRPASLLGIFLLAFLLVSCGGGGSNGGCGSTCGGGGGTQPGTYTITITGTSGTAGTSGYLTHTAPSTVTLIVSQ
jgi:hypothetical protein